MGTGLPNYEESESRWANDDDTEDTGWLVSIIFGIIWVFAFVLSFPEDLIHRWKKRKSKKLKNA